MSETDHIVIAGSGRVGFRVAEQFANRGHDVSVIENDPEVVEDLEGADGVEIQTGDATKPSILRAVLTDRTRVLAALTDREEANLAICLGANQLDPTIRTVARIEHEDSDEYTEYVDTVYFPERASVRAAVNAISGSDVRTLEEVTGDLEILDIRLDYDAPAAGEVVSDALPEGSVVISQAGGHVAVQHSTTLVAGRRFLVAADHDVVDEVIRQFRGSVGD